MKTEIKGSSPSNSIDHIEMDSIESDSDEKIYIVGISHIDGISYTDGISHIEESIHIKGSIHIDRISYSHIIPPRIKYIDYPT